MKIVEILYITKNPYDMTANDIKKQETMVFKKEIKPLNGLIFENDMTRKIYYVQDIKNVLTFIKYRLFDTIINVKLFDKMKQKLIKLALR